LEIAITFVWFRPDGSAATAPLAGIFGSGLFFVAAVMLVVGRQGNAYNRDLRELESRPDEYERALKALGGLPLKGLALFAAVLTAYLGALFSLPSAFPIRDGISVQAFLLIFSLGLLNAAFVFVISDSLTTKSLLEHELTTYPAALRDNRQARKTFIIPMFMTIMSLIFASSLTYLVMHRALARSGSIGGDTLFGTVTTVLLYVILVTMLVRVWNKTTSLIYRSITSQLDALNSADKDLRRRIFITSVDELGTIAGLTNRFCSTLEGNIIELKRIQDELSITGEELQENAESSGAAVRQITGGIAGLREKTGAQSASVGESSVAVRQIAKNIEGLDGMIENQAASIVEASSSVEEMVGTISSINASIERMSKEFGRLAEEAQSGSGLQSTTGAKIQDIVDRSNSLQEANKVVAAISAQTNLLAMNAAIEAAHAGDAGQGFSVVADEIRRLADNSSKESRKIKNEISAVQGSIQEVVAATKDSEKAFSAIAGRIGEIGDLVSQVHMAIREQNEGAKQILEALKSMNDITAQVRSGSQEMNEGSATIATEMQKLLDSAHAVETNMSEMSASVDNVTESANKVSRIVSETKESIAGMDAVVDQFKTR
jgi:methyl-accepting chemotaxis protein